MSLSIFHQPMVGPVADINPAPKVAPETFEGLTSDDQEVLGIEVQAGIELGELNLSAAI